MVLFSRRLPSLVRVPASPVPRSQRYYEGATTSHARISGHLFVSLPPPTATSCFVSAAALPQARRRSCRPGPWCRLPVVSGSSYVDAYGTSQVFRRSFPRLCSVPRPRSSQRVLASTGYIDAAPATHTAKASAIPDFGADLQLQHSLTVRFRRGVAAAPARLASGWRTAPLPGGLRTLWIATKGFSSLV